MNRINLICLGVSNLAQSLAFYQQLGFHTSAQTGAPIVFFNNQGSKLELFPLDQLAQDINAAQPPATHRGGFAGFTLACNVKSAAEVDQLINRARAIGAPIAKEPQPTSWGGYSGYFQDPDGYYWEVAYGANWTFDADDMLVID